MLGLIVQFGQSSGLQSAVARIRPDRFTLAMVGTLAAATMLPARGEFVGAVDVLGRLSVFLLFFLHGANLSSRTMLGSLVHWRFHGLVLASTFLVFPLLGLLLAPVGEVLLDNSLYAGLLFLCCLPSTVQSSIAFTSIARGNVSAAVCTASVSNLLGVFITPLLVALLLSRHSEISFASSGPIFTTILLPFVLGQVVRRWIGEWLARRKKILSLVDRGSVLIMVYAAFGKAVTSGIWNTVTLNQLGIVLLLCCLLLAGVAAFTHYGAGLLRLTGPDKPALMFCGSMKSLVTGVPMAVILFPAETAGAIVLPLMIFHQLQLLVFAWISRSYQRRDHFEAQPDARVS